MGTVFVERSQRGLLLEKYQPERLAIKSAGTSDSWLIPKQREPSTRSTSGFMRVSRLEVAATYQFSTSCGTSVAFRLQWKLHYNGRCIPLLSAQERDTLGSR